jgi:dihydrofolate synthase / folylpolyglutamate synthase
VTFDRYQSACAYLVEDLWHGPAAATPRGDDPQLRARALLAELGNPQEAFPVIHVGGTAGKGSTAAMAASILSEAGYRTGLYVSPFLQAFIERISVDGLLIAPDQFAAGVKRLKPLVERMQKGPTGPPSLLEVLFAVACQYFREERVDVAVIEVGLGGRTDCTNVFEPATVTAITNVGKDHTNVLGRTIARIAREKAAIIKPGTRTVTAATRDGLKVIRERCRQVASPLWQTTAPADLKVAASGGSLIVQTPLRRLANLNPAMPGLHQAPNAMLAVAAVDALHTQDRAFSADDTAVARGMKARLPGRLERVQERPMVVLDGAHNPPAATALREALSRRVVGDYERLILLIGILADKDRAGITRRLAPLADHIVVTAPPFAERAGDPERTAIYARRYARARRLVEVVPNPDAALDRALEAAGSGDLVCITGSLYLVGHLRSRWFPVEDILGERRIIFLDD